MTPTREVLADKIDLILHSAWSRSKDGKITQYAPDPAEGYDREWDMIACRDAILALINKASDGGEETGWRSMDSAPRDATVLIATEAKETHPWLAGKPAKVFPAYIDEDGRLCDAGTWRPDLGFDGPCFSTIAWRPLPPAPSNPIPNEGGAA